MDAEDNDTLDWSWDALTDGERTEDDDWQNLADILFSGVPSDQIEEHARKLRDI